MEHMGLMSPQMFLQNLLDQRLERELPKVTPLYLANAHVQVG